MQATFFTSIMWYIIYLVVLYGAKLKNKCFNTWNCIGCLFLVGFTTPRDLGFNPTRGGRGYQALMP